MFEAVQQPVGGGGIAARLELSEPDEPRHAGVDRLVEQMLKVAPKPGRDPLGDAGLRPPAFRVDQRVGAEPLDRRRGRQDGSRASAGLDEPADQVLVRLRLWRFFAEPVAELARRAAREGPESVQVAQLSKMLVPIVVVAGRMVRVRRQASTNLRTRSSFDCACGASSRSRSPSSRAAPPEKDRNPYRWRSSARCSCRVSDRTA